MARAGRSLAIIVAAAVGLAGTVGGVLLWHRQGTGEQPHVERAGAGCYRPRRPDEETRDAGGVRAHHDCVTDPRSPPLVLGREADGEPSRTHVERALPIVPLGVCASSEPEWEVNGLWASVPRRGENAPPRRPGTYRALVRHGEPEVFGPEELGRDDQPDRPHFCPEAGAEPGAPSSTCPQRTVVQRIRERAVSDRVQLGKNERRPEHVVIAGQPRCERGSGPQQ